MPDIDSVIFAAREIMLRAIAYDADNFSAPVVKAGKRLFKELLITNEPLYTKTTERYVPNKILEKETAKVLLGTLLANMLSPEEFAEIFVTPKKLPEEIYFIGTEALEGRLDFSFLELKLTYPMIRSYLGDIEKLMCQQRMVDSVLIDSLTLREQDIEELRRIFESAMTQNDDTNDNDPLLDLKAEYSMQVDLLAKKVLFEFERKPMFSLFKKDDVNPINFNVCKKVAKNCLWLAKKIRHNTLTEQDVEAFEKGSYKLGKYFGWFKAIMRTLVTIATLTAVGVGLGAIASPLGALIGGCVGFTVGLYAAKKVAKRYPVKFFHQSPVAEKAIEIANQLSCRPAP